MGVFDFLKKRKKEEYIKFNQIENWINTYLEESDINIRIRNFKSIIKKKISEIKESLETLENASLMNDNIPQRVKQILIGNKKNYIQKINLFLDELIIPDDYSSIREFSKELTDKIDELSKETQKSYFVLKEFLESELAIVARKVKEIEDEAIKFKSDIEKENLPLIEEIKSKLLEFENSKNMLSNLKEQRLKSEHDLKDIKSKESNIKKKISELKNDSHYKEYEELKSEKEKLSNKLQVQKKLIISHFSTLEKAFRKYKRQSMNEGLIDNYLENFSEALLHDEKFEILKVMDKMKDSLSSLGLKDKKEEKTKQEIEKLNETFLKKLVEDLKSRMSKYGENKNKLLANTSAMNISEQESWLENTQDKIKEKEEEIIEIENKIDRTNPSLIKNDLVDLLKKFSVIIEK